MKKLVAILLTILMLFSLFQVALRENVAKAEGTGWQELSTGSNGLMKDIAISAVAIDPKNPNVIYVGTDFHGVYKSEDAGASWKAISSSVTEMTNVLSLAIDPKNTNTLYAGLFNFGRPRIYKSEDGGLTWKMLEKAPQSAVFTLSIDPNNTNVIFAYSRSDGVYRSDDGGLNWEKLDLSVENLWWYCIAIDKKNSNIVYAVQYGPIYKSEDKGNHWTKIWQVEKNGNLGAVMCVAIDPTNTNVLYAGTDGYGIFKSIDGGKSWTQTALSNANNDSILINPTNPEAMYAIENNRKAIEETLDGWKSWKYMDLTGLPTNMTKDNITGQGALRSLAIDSKGNLFLGTVKGLFEYKPLSGTSTVCTYTHLLMVYPNTDVVYTKNGKTEKYTGTMSDNLKTTVVNAFLNLPQLIEDGSANMVSSVCDVIEIPHPITKITNIQGNYSWLSYQNIQDDLQVYAPKAKYDSVHVVWNSGPIDAYWGLGGVFINDGTTTFSSLIAGQEWWWMSEGEDFGEPFLHEWLHGVCRFYANLGYLMPEEDADGAESHGYTKSPTEGWMSYYRDLMRGKVWEPKVSAYTGITKEAWSERTPKQRAIPPSPPQNLSASISNSSITLTWNESQQGAYPIGGYAIYRGTFPGGESSTLINTVDTNTTTYTDTNITLGTTYYYYVKAFDVKAFDNQTPPNYSAPSNEVNAEITDTTPPEISVSSPLNYSTGETDSVALIGIATDESGIDKLTVNGSEVSVASNGSFSKTVNLTEGTNTITIIATDKAGNKTTKTIIVTYEKPVQTIVITLQPDNAYMAVNGVSREIDLGRGTKPVIIPEWSRTVVPIRAIVEALGGTIEWDGTERKVTINFKGTTIELWIDNPKAEVNGVTKWIDDNNHDVKPIIVNDRTMLPLRFVAESLGCDVDWDNDTRTITITYGG